MKFISCMDLLSKNHEWVKFDPNLKCYCPRFIVFQRQLIKRSSPSDIDNPIILSSKSYVLSIGCRDVISGWAEWDLAHPEFVVSVNPIPTRGAN